MLTQKFELQTTKQFSLYKNILSHNQTEFNYYYNSIIIIIILITKQIGLIGAH